MRRKTNLVGTLLAGTIVFVPIIVFAASLKSMVATILSFLDQVGVALIGVAALLVVYGIVRYITAGDDPNKLSDGGKVLLWGIISLFVMVSMWGLVKLLLSSIFPTTSTSFELKEQLFNP